MGCCTSGNALEDLANPSRIANGITDEPQIVPHIDEHTSVSIHALIDEISNNAMILPDCINGALLWNIGILIGKSLATGDPSPSRDQLIRLIETNLENQLQTKTIQLNSAYIYMFSEISFRSNKDQYKAYCKRIFDDCQAGLTNMSQTKAEKFYLKSILAWNFKGDSKYFIDLKKLSEQQLTELSQPLLVEYSELESKDDDVLKLQIDDNVKYNNGTFELTPQFIRKQIIGMSDEVFRWYDKGFFIQSENEALVVKQFEVMDFTTNEVNEWLDGMRNSEKVLEPSIVLRQLLWRISMRINAPFQILVQQAFQTNRRTLGLEPNDDEDVGYRAAPIKTKSRVWSKVFRDYSEQYDFPNAYFMVQDWIRCALVCETSDELVSLFHLICSDQYFGGKIIRVKNGFHRDSQAEFGYRVLLINAIFENMIVEVQLMLLPFLKVRKKMHLHYKVVRAEKSNDLAQDFSSING
eukprot:127520_1